MFYQVVNLAVRIFGMYGPGAAQSRLESRMLLFGPLNVALLTHVVFIFSDVA